MNIERICEIGSGNRRWRRNRNGRNRKATGCAPTTAVSSAAPTTLHLCSKCYKDHCLKEQQASTAKLAVEKSLTQASSRSPSESVSSDLDISPESKSAAAAIEGEEATVVQAAAQPSRCAACRRRVGLTGFPCRCGTTFCGSHRYPEQHSCSFDYKSVGKEAIAKANPVVKAREAR
ncbi:A20/AN1-like zinc finger family protein [Actinidia rufa]|uniref:A20/AN1-like zinc finger family protein n=1 Tax=Actinidia rufa TaxID=165716 RepID=A0A7J0GKB0_9ERIC|nr:A20/AN1-like zinc finger family protein [Actinidia rufa]